MSRIESRIGVGMIGLGTVGGGVENWFKQGGGETHGLELRKVAVANPDKPRDTQVPLTTDVKDVIKDPSIQVVIEVMGGISPATDYILDAINEGKNVITANKAAIATNMPLLFDAARSQEVDLAFEASVGGGIRIIQVINSFQAERIESIKAILNGTSNYILSQMERGLTFEEALAQAREKGFAEADHSSDTGGFDTRYKLAILASLGFNTWFSPENISRRGMAEISPIDLDFAAKYGTEEGESGYAVKLLAIAKRHKDSSAELRVTPALISRNHQLASVSDEYNAVYLEGSNAGPQMLTGKGAGCKATTSAVTMDLLRITSNMRAGVTDYLPALDGNMQIVDPAKIETAGYFRVNLKHIPGSGERFFGIMRQNGLNVADSLQRKRFAQEINGETVIPDINTVESAPQKDIEQALSDLKTSDRVIGEPLFIPFET